MAINWVLLAKTVGRRFCNIILCRRGRQVIRHANFARTTQTDNYIGYSTRIDVPVAKQIHLNDTLYVGPKRKVSYKMWQQVLINGGLRLLWPISKPLFILLENIHKVLGNWGWSIIVLTLLVKIALMWFSNKSYYSMAKMRQIAPRLEN